MTKKRGRKKKRGPKKKKPIRILPPHSSYNIYLIKNGKQVDYFGNYKVERSAYQAYYNLLKENKNIVFPKRFLNTTKNHKKDTPEKFIEEPKYELILVKRRENGALKITTIRNEYGEYIETQTSSDKWVVLERKPYDLEETFWVYGYNPFTQRKNFNFIVNEIVKKQILDNRRIMHMRMAYNKLLLETNDKVDMVICKNTSDTIRLYNEIERWCERNKAKRIVCSGRWKGKGDCVNVIKELTGWTESKICRYTTSS